MRAVSLPPSLTLGMAEGRAALRQIPSPFPRRTPGWRHSGLVYHGGVLLMSLVIRLRHLCQPHGSPCAGVKGGWHPSKEKRMRW